MSNHYGTRRIAESTTADDKPWAMWFSGASDGNIDVDADGVMSTPAVGIIDLSNMLSQRLGRQMSQMMVYEIDYIRLELLNVDDLNDNDTGACFSGYLQWHSPTVNKVKALKLASKVERLSEGDEIDGDSIFLSTTDSYKGIRFGMTSDNQVSYQTSEDFSNLPGSEWNLYNIFNAYDATHSPAGSTKDNYLARGTGVEDDISFSMSYQNKVNVDSMDTYSPQSHPFTLENAKIDCLGGLMQIYITHSSVDDGLNTIIDDDYEVRVTVGVKGWRKI